MERSTLTTRPHDGSTGQQLRTGEPDVVPASGSLPGEPHLSSALRASLVVKKQTYRDVLVMPQEGRYRGGPVWPLFHLRVRARTCWGPVPVPIDARPRSSRGPYAALEAGVWCGLVSLHYGHMIANFGMRLAQAGHLVPDLPLLFCLPAGYPSVAPEPFWQMIDALRVDRARIMLVSAPTRVKTLHVFPQAERLLGGGPSRRHLDFMDAVLGDRARVAKDIRYVYVSRAALGMDRGAIAGEGYLQEALRALGVLVYHPERHTVRDQLDLYERAETLIFCEGSAVHTLQLAGRFGPRVAVLARRPLVPFAWASLRPRFRALTYLRAVAGLVHGVGGSRRAQRNRGVAVLDEARLLTSFARLGLDLAPVWDGPDFRARRDTNLRAWIAARKLAPRPSGEPAFVDRQLTALGVDVRYGEPAAVPR